MASRERTYMITVMPYIIQWHTRKLCRCHVFLSMGFHKCHTLDRTLRSVLHLHWHWMCIVCKVFFRSLVPFPVDLLCLTSGSSVVLHLFCGQHFQSEEDTALLTACLNLLPLSLLPLCHWLVDELSWSWHYSSRIIFILFHCVCIVFPFLVLLTFMDQSLISLL